jgi:hypothetical protein
MIMKNYILAIFVLLTLAMACTKEENIYYNEEEFDLKASKMTQVGSLFESIARQPEAANFLITATEGIYSDYTVLLPLSDEAVVQRGKARGSSFGLLLASIARQPEAFEVLDSAAEKFLGKYNPDYISDEMAEITKTYALPGLTESIARQPEADSLFNIVCKKYLNFEITGSVN